MRLARIVLLSFLPSVGCEEGTQPSTHLTSTASEDPVSMNPPTTFQDEEKPYDSDQCGDDPATAKVFDLGVTDVEHPFYQSLFGGRYGVCMRSLEQGIEAMEGTQTYNRVQMFEDRGVLGIFTHDFPIWAANSQFPKQYHLTEGETASCVGIEDPLTYLEIGENQSLMGKAAAIFYMANVLCAKENIQNNERESDGYDPCERYPAACCDPFRDTQQREEVLRCIDETQSRLYGILAKGSHEDDPKLILRQRESITILIYSPN